MDLNNVLEFEKLDSSFTLIDSSTDGSFLIHYLLSNCVRQTNSRTFLITFSQTLSHFKSVQAKLGNSTHLNTALSSDKLVNFDLMTKLSDQFYDTTVQSTINLFDDILTKIKNFILSCNDNSEKIYVIIDDLSIVHLTGSTDNNLLEFLTKLESLSDNLHIILYIQSFYANKYFITDLVHMSDLFIKVENLSTGYSKDINGQMRVFKLDLNSNRKEAKYLYKINERNVQLFQI